MVKMPPDIKDIVAKQKPLPIATADKSGKPKRRICYDVEDT